MRFQNFLMHLIQLIHINEITYYIIIPETD